jgi:cysteine desulfurase
MTTIYLDHNATTPIDPAVCDEMLSCMRSPAGNPSSIHSSGQAARRVIERARERAARLVGAKPGEIIFTGGGTEADNIAILGSVYATGRANPAIVTSAIEHQAVMNTCIHVKSSGGQVSILGVNHEGLVDPGSVRAYLDDDTALVSVMLANNDTGTVQPVAALAQLARARGIPVHTDAVQAVGKIPVDVKALGVDLLSFSGHKIYGPQGTGALYIRKGTKLNPITFGGHQERGLRPGTENVAAIAGFGKACELAAARLAEDAADIESLRSTFEAAVIARVPGAVVNGQGAARIPNTSNISFEGIDGEMLVVNLDLLGVAASTGAACSTADREPSHVLLAMGRTAEQARSSVRFSFGRGNTADDALRAAEQVAHAVRMLRGGAVC